MENGLKIALKIPVLVLIAWGLQSGSKAGWEFAAFQF
jgi:hypothetical protein